VSRLRARLLQRGDTISQVKHPERDADAESDHRTAKECHRARAVHPKPQKLHAAGSGKAQRHQNSSHLEQFHGPDPMLMIGKQHKAKND
jgi:hypothetical protein